MATAAAIVAVVAMVSIICVGGVDRRAFESRPEVAEGRSSTGRKSSEWSEQAIEAKAGEGVVVAGQLWVNGSTARARVGSSFICATLDWWPPQKCDFGTCSWQHASLLNLNLSSPLLRNAITAFSPLKIRLGGTLQDRVVYDFGEARKECVPFSLNRTGLFGFNGGCLSMARWDDLNSFFQATGAVVVFGLNALYGRRGPQSSLGPWNSTNARSFIQYTQRRGYKIFAWELGNELSFNGVRTIIPAKQYAADVKELRSIVDEVYKNNTISRPLIVAPDGFFQEQWTQDFFAAFGKGALTIDILTHHIYNLGAGGDHNLSQRVMDPFYLDGEARNFQAIRQTLQNHSPSVDAWVGEAGGAYGSGQHLVTDAFMSGFWYLDQMGMAASYGTKAYCRQTLVGGNYGLLNTTTFVPNPDYYGALLWHRLMGLKVLDTKVAASPLLRAYTHCGKGTKGVTFLLLNYSPITTYKMNFSIQGARILPAQTRMEYHLRPKHGNLNSQIVLLNGIPLRVGKGESLPLLIPTMVTNYKPIVVQPSSIVFVSMPYLHAPACNDPN